jgi:hypothetical protein
LDLKSEVDLKSVTDTRETKRHSNVVFRNLNLGSKPAFLNTGKPTYPTVASGFQKKGSVPGADGSHL